MIPGLGRSAGEGIGYPLQYSGLENSMDCIWGPWGRKESDMTERLSLSLSESPMLPLGSYSSSICQPSEVKKLPSSIWGPELSP